MDIDAILKELTLEEKASLCSGEDFWHTKAIERLGIPSIMVSDGPHGLRKNVENAENPNTAIKAVCFPSACALACSFDRELVGEMGKALGEQCQAEEVSVILGPGCNIKRSPLCGRNFEYFSEDPYLASQMAIAHIKGVQSKGVGTSLKHFAANNQESRRMSIEEIIDERTLHEIYLAAFEQTIKQAKPWTVMCSYNKINGVYSSQNKHLLTDILRSDWGFEGLVVSDWGAVDDRVKGIKAGLDLEMPSSMGKNDKYIVKAVNSGELDENELDKCVRKILELIQKSVQSKTEMTWDKERHHALAEKLSLRSAVLLKNDDKLLPLDKSAKIAFIGAFAEQPRYQGGGSSHINSFKTVSALEAVEGNENITYARGFNLEKDESDLVLEEEAVKAAKNADCVVIFAGLPEAFESEGYDRTHMCLPSYQLELIDKLCEVNENIAVVLHNGSPVELPFDDKVKAILEMYLGGQAVGSAEVKLLFGEENPSGKLAETFPEKLEDNPSYLNFPGDDNTVRYAEGIFVGYRYYEKKKIAVCYAFGHGLSYTDFEYSDMKVSDYEISETDTVTVQVTVTNTGSRDGAEVVQLYIAPKQASVMRPIKELKGFERVYLKAGESRRIVFRLDKSAFAYYSEKIHDFYSESGEYTISLSSSSADERLSADVHFNASKPLPIRFTLDSLGGDVQAIPEGKAMLEELLKSIGVNMTGNDERLDGDEIEIALKMLLDMPLHTMVSFSKTKEITREKMQQFVDKLNEKFG
ncbi:MAG: glycoside hydrolase family 3 C-terminal domain-containing protein [Ruminococcus sp.]|nr:glycoside hydrolase family 3 C-terminal domain-containing protein [Ruminococcus sp.]